MEAKSVMKEIAELYGLSISEPFCIRNLFCEDSNEHRIFRFMEDGLDEKIDGHWEIATNGELLLYLIVTGGYDIINNESWHPAYGEIYYVPDLSSIAHFREERWLDSINDGANYINGLVCRHVKKAKEKADMMLDVLKKKGY